jgi:hypothetical protein
MIVSAAPVIVSMPPALSQISLKFDEVFHVKIIG